MVPAAVTHRPERCLAVRILHQACGLCPLDNHLGDAESSELHHLADSQMDSERHTDLRCDLRDMSRA
jgi:hypothetical protein